MQRLRITFSRGPELKYITHLDLMRLWERALRRAGALLAYSQGFSPHPRLSLAAPLAVGTTSQAELLDIYLQRRTSPYYLIKALEGQLPAGIDLLQVEEVGPWLPSLQSQVREAEYRVVVGTERSRAEVEMALGELLAKDSLPWQHSRGREAHRYDLRALIEDLRVAGWLSGECTLGMRLRADSSGSGRPEQVTAALGFEERPRSIHRTRLTLR